MCKAQILQGLTKATDKAPLDGTKQAPDLGFKPAACYTEADLDASLPTEFSQAQPLPAHTTRRDPCPSLKHTTCQ